MIRLWSNNDIRFVNHCLISGRPHSKNKVRHRATNISYEMVNHPKEANTCPAPKLFGCWTCGWVSLNPFPTYLWSMLAQLKNMLKLCNDGMQTDTCHICCILEATGCPFRMMIGHCFLISRTRQSRVSVCHTISRTSRWRDALSTGVR